MKTCAILTLLIVIGAVAAYGQDPGIYGAYQFCAMACQTIQIKPDHTFNLQLNGDLYNDERYAGTWVPISHNKVHAIIPEDHSPMKVVEGKLSDSEGYRVEVFDETGAIVDGATVIPLGSWPIQRFETNNGGVANIPICDEFELSILSYRGRYRPTNKGNNKFVVTLTIDQVSALALDEIWLIEKGRLYKEHEDGVINKEFWLEKISKKRERAIFKK